ncbi:putative metal-binding motif-containing protein, partial [Candidatus Woesearchaeota archaeon]|nr:putative metal-binding motif-containing protein [Candidatus Woesearchaeota archaeon]
MFILIAFLIYSIRFESIFSGKSILQPPIQIELQPGGTYYVSYTITSPLTQAVLDISGTGWVSLSIQDSIFYEGQPSNIPALPTSVPDFSSEVNRYCTSGYPCTFPLIIKSTTGGNFTLDSIRFVAQQDADGDGYNATGGSGSVDCNDRNASIHPGATEVCTDGVDNNCDGNTDAVDIM